MRGYQIKKWIKLNKSSCLLLNYINLTVLTIDYLNLFQSISYIIATLGYDIDNLQGQDDPLSLKIIILYTNNIHKES